jgi:hypothetical protein
VEVLRRTTQLLGAATMVQKENIAARDVRKAVEE